MKTFVLSNMKGGIGKSISSVALANGLHDHGKRVLLLDMDPQSNAAFMSGVSVLDVQTTLYDVFRGEAAIEDAIQPLRFGYDIAICGLKATAADVTFTQLGRERILTEALEPVREKYDYAVIDTSPSLGLLTTAAMTASDYLVIPATADPLAIQGALQLDAYVRNIRKYCNRNLAILGILITQYSARTTLAKSMEGTIQAAAKSMGTTIFNTRIRRAQALQDAALTQRDIFTSAKAATATKDYKSFVSEILERMDDNGDE